MEISEGSSGMNSRSRSRPRQRAPLPLQLIERGEHGFAVMHDDRLGHLELNCRRSRSQSYPVQIHSPIAQESANEEKVEPLTTHSAFEPIVSARLEISRHVANYTKVWCAAAKVLWTRWILTVTFFSVPV